MNEIMMRDSFLVQETEDRKAVIVWGTLHAMDGLHDMTMDLLERVEFDKNPTMIEFNGMIQTLYGQIKAALREEARTATGTFRETQMPLVGFEMDWPTLLLTVQLLRNSKDALGNSVLLRYEGYLCLLENAMHNALKDAFPVDWLFIVKYMRSNQSHPETLLAPYLPKVQKQYVRGMASWWQY